MIAAIAACTVGVHLATYHFDRSAGFNETNLGGYVVCDRWAAGAYRNSERADSSYAGYTYSLGPVDVVVGVVTGYKRGPMPMVLPSVKVSKHLRLTLLPPVPSATVNTMGVHLSAEY